MLISLVKKYDLGIEFDGFNMDKSEIFLESDFVDISVFKFFRVSKICESLISFFSMDSGNYDGIIVMVDDGLENSIIFSILVFNLVLIFGESKSDAFVISVIEIFGGDLQEKLNEKVISDKMFFFVIEDKVSKIVSVDV